MSSQVHPIRVDASLEPQLHRGLWLVKWLLVLPHYVVLAFLWLAFVVLSVVAFFAILFTGRYPRAIFDFNVGVLRWSWRVAYYAYGALGTDRYPPFTLDDVPDYPAHLAISYPEHLSRGLVLVKWWLLALPHYLVLGLFLGGGYAFARADSGSGAPLVWGGGLIGLLVLVAAVVLLFTGSYPRGIFDLVLGLNRWVLRVAGYAALMTDAYPPFRLDMGGDDPGSDALVMDPPRVPAEAAGQTPTRAPGSSERPWSAGRVVSIVFGCLALLTGGGLIASGVALAVVQQSARDDAGFVMSSHEQFTTTTHAVTTSGIEARIGDGWRFVPDNLLGRVKLSVTPTGAQSVFVGIGPSAQVEAYLADVAHSTVVDFRYDGPFNGDPVYENSGVGGPITLPDAAPVTWAASVAGSGQQAMTWQVQDGDWALLVMNVDGSAPVAFDAAVGAEFPALGWVIAAVLSLGVVLVLVGGAFIIGALRARPA